MKVSKGFLILFFIWTMTIQFVQAQPFIYEQKNDTTLEGAEMLHFCSYDKINLSNGQIAKVVYSEAFIEDNTETFILEGNDLTHNSITNLHSGAGCDLGMINPDHAIFSKKNHKIFITGYNKGESPLTIFNSNLILCEDTTLNFDLGNNMILSKDETKLYFPYSNDNYIAKFDTIRVTTISTSTYEVIKSGEPQNLGYPKAYRYELLWGRNGKLLIQSTIKKNNKYIGSYYNVYDLDNNISTPFIFSKEDVRPYFTNDGHYLILAQTKDSISGDMAYPHNTGRFEIYELSTQRLVKILKLPPRRDIYTFDNFPDKIYYYNDETEHAITLKIDSLVNNPSGPINSPKVIMYNLGNSVFTADFAKGKIKYELGSGFTIIKPEPPTKDKLLYNEFDESNNLLGVFSFDNGYIKGTYTNNKSKKVFHFSRIDMEP
jgi:hypothetical protein